MKFGAKSLPIWYVGKTKYRHISRSLTLKILGSPIPIRRETVHRSRHVVKSKGTKSRSSPTLKQRISRGAMIAPREISYEKLISCRQKSRKNKQACQKRLSRPRSPSDRYSRSWIADPHDRWRLVPIKNGLIEVFFFKLSDVDGWWLTLQVEYRPRIYESLMDALFRRKFTWITRISWIPASIDRRVVIIHGNSDVQVVLYSICSTRILRSEVMEKNARCRTFSFETDISEIHVFLRLFELEGKLRIG